VLEKPRERPDPKEMAATNPGDEHPRGELGLNLERLPVGVDLGDQRSHSCILGLEGETLAERRLRTTPQDVGEFFQAVQCGPGGFRGGDTLCLGAEVVCGCGREVLAANPA
jgi:hypothetical protein